MGVLSLPDPINSSWVSLLHQTEQGLVWFIASVKADLRKAAAKVFQSVFTQLWLKREQTAIGRLLTRGKNFNWCFLWRSECPSKAFYPSFWRSHLVGLNRWIIQQKVEQQHIICIAGDQETVLCIESGWWRQQFRLKRLTSAALFRSLNLFLHWSLHCSVPCAIFFPTNRWFYWVVLMWFFILLHRTVFSAFLLL